MAITILSDRIKIGEYSLYEAYNGIYFDGTAAIKGTLEKSHAQGTVSGFTSGGYVTAPAGALVNTVDKFTFTTNANATDAGDLSVPRMDTTGHSSSVSGYASGGRAPPGNAIQLTIEKYPFAGGSFIATSVASLTPTSRYRGAGQSSSTSGYFSGGIPSTNIIDKFPFATDSNATNIGVLTAARAYASGQSSSDAGYTSGGSSTNTVDRFPFATDTSASDVGDLTIARELSSGQSSSAAGYTSGGQVPGTNYNTIDKFPFATNANATNVGGLSATVSGSAGQSSTVSGYISGGTNSVSLINTIEKFPFATNANASDVGDLTQIRYLVSGQQY